MYYQSENDNEDAILIESWDHMDSFIGYSGYFFSHSGLKIFDDKKEPFSHIEFVQYYKGKELQFLDELKDCDGGETPSILYLGPTKQARKTLRGNNSKSARHYRHNSDEPIGEMIFQGKRIYSDLDCTSSGIEHI